MTRTALATISAALFLNACGSSSPSAPTPQPTTANHQLTGTINSTTSPITGATVTVLDGPNAGQTATTNGAGRYAFPALQQSGFTIQAAASGYQTATKAITLTADTIADLQLEKTRAAVLIALGNLSNYATGAPDTFDFRGMAQNVGDACAVHIGGFVDMLDATGATVASRAFTIQPDTPIAPQQTFPINGCCFSRAELATSATYAVRWTFQSSQTCQ